MGSDEETTNSVVRIPRPNPPDTSVPRDTLMPRSNMSAILDVPLLKLKFELRKDSETVSVLSSTK